ncbi:MAG: ATP synthase F1 subunit gamma [Planctomycetes bacterium]|nr:ATP synthase F1 subunit gamma [Planctomycetota bacterium]
MAQIREIKKRIKAVGNIQRITNTMQMIATARFKSAMDRATATKPYTEKVRGLVEELAANATDIKHPLFESPDPSPGRELVVVMTSNRGLCGAYNSNVLRTASHHLRAATSDSELEVVGKKGLAFFRFAGFDITQFHGQFGDKPVYADVEELADRYMADFIDGGYDRISLCYMRFISTGVQRPTVSTLLPLKPPVADEDGAGAGVGVQYDFSPDVETLLQDLLPITVKTALYQAFNDAVVSEQVARMVAMKAATDNAGKLGKTLKRTFNRARQAQITTELNEIIGGASGLD